MFGSTGLNNWYLGKLCPLCRAVPGTSHSMTHPFGPLEMQSEASVASNKTKLQIKQDFKMSNSRGIWMNKWPISSLPCLFLSSEYIMIL